MSVFAHSSALVKLYSEADYFGTGEQPPRFVAVAAAAEVLDRAAGLCAVHLLRAYDAIQLGIALTVRDSEPGCGHLAAFDAGLRGAAAAEGFALLPAQLAEPT